MSPELNEVEILLLEDNPYDAEMALRVLEKLLPPEKILHLKDGAAGLDFIFKRRDFEGLPSGHPPKLVLLDLKLPKVEGLKVLEEIKSEERSRDIPVVILSSSAEERDVRSSYQYGANSYIVKPMEYDLFVETLSKLGQYWLNVNHPPR